MAECKKCGEDLSNNTEVIIGPFGPHYAKEICKSCDALIKFIKKPENEGRRTKTSKYSAFDFEYDGCELCRRPRIMLGEYETLEVHHKDVNYENDTRDNVMLLCTLCHKQVHLYHAFLYLHFMTNPTKGTADYF
jgi:hypothetical protein